VLTWRPKLSSAEKFIYVQRSTDGGRTFSQPVVLNTATHALLPIHVASDSKKRMYVVWVDERKHYNLYMNYSVDGGKTFLSADINLTPSSEFVSLPYLLIDGETINLFFLEQKGEEKTRRKRNRLRYSICVPVTVGRPGQHLLKYMNLLTGHPQCSVQKNQATLFWSSGEV